MKAGYVVPAVAFHTSPADVPGQLNAAQLRQALSFGRPIGQLGTLQTNELSCPTVTINAHVVAKAPLLLVHGLGHDIWDWAPLMAASSLRGHQMMAFDLPGFGFSDKPAGRRWELRTLVDAVMAAALSCAQPPVVVASSLGAHIVILAALEAPELFGKLVLAAPGGLIDVGPLTAATLRAHYSIESIVQRSEADLLATSMRIFADAQHPLCQQLAARKLAIHRSAEQRSYAVPFSGYVDDVFRHVVRDRFASLQVPTLVVSGDRDLVVPPDACETAASRLRCPFVRMPGVGHTPHLEATAAFASLVADFAGAT